MKKGLITAVIGVYILGLCTVFAWAALPENVEDALPPDARDLLEQLDDDTADSGTLSAGAAKLWNKAWTLLTAEVRSSVRVMVVLLGAVLLYGVAEGSFQAAGHPLMANFTPLAFVLVITMTAAGDVQTMIGSGTETMEQLDVPAKPSSSSNSSTLPRRMRPAMWSALSRSVTCPTIFTTTSA